MKKRKSSPKNKRGFILLVVLTVAVAAWAAVDTIQHISNSEAGSNPYANIAGPVWVTGYQNNSFFKDIKSSDTKINLELSSDSLSGVKSLTIDAPTVGPAGMTHGGVGTVPSIPRILVYKDYVGLYANGELIQKLTPTEPTGLAARYIKAFKTVEAMLLGVGAAFETWPPVVEPCPNRLSFQITVDQALRTAISSGKSLSIAFMPDVTGIDDYRKWFLENHILSWHRDAALLKLIPRNSLVADSRAKLSGQRFTRIKFVITNNVTTPQVTQPKSAAPKSAAPPQLAGYQILTNSSYGGNYALNLFGTNLIVNSSAAPEPGSTVTIRYRGYYNRRHTFDDKTFYGKKDYITLYVNKSSLLDNISSIDLTTPRGTTNTSIRK